MRIRCVAVAAVLTLGSAGCKESPPVVADYHESRPGTLMIWADGDRAEAVQPFAEAFAARHGIKAEVYGLGSADSRRSDFIRGVREGKGPDIYLGEHQDLSEFVAAGVVAPVPLTDAQRAAYEPLAIRAGTYDGQLYLVPHAITNVMLYRNVTLVPDAPATIEDLVATGRRLVAAGQATEVLGLPVGAQGDLESVYPLYSSAGGYLFGTNPDRSPAATDHRVGAPSSVDALRRIAGLGALKTSIDLGKVASGLTGAKMPFVVVHPAAAELVRPLSQAKWAVSAVPGFAGGRPARPLVRVQGFYLSAAAQNKALAAQFLAERVGTVDLQESLCAAWSTAPALTAAIGPVTAAHPETQALIDVARTGELIPSTPRMQRVWTPFGQAEVVAVTGGDVEAAVRAARDRIGTA